MNIHTLENEEIKIEVNLHGAELKSLVKKETGREYMWEADPKFWGRNSPVLFPFVGSVANGEFRAKGKSYPMGQHGFVRDMDFQLEKQDEKELVFVLESNEETLAKYPYAFRLHIGYQLAGSAVKVIWKVENPSEESLPFSIGGHPAFCTTPVNDQGEVTCMVHFEGKDKVVSHQIESGVVGGIYHTYDLKEGNLPVTKDLFDLDALIIENQDIHKVSLCDANGEKYLTVNMDVPLFGVWSPVGKNAPFVCIEPWYGRCDAAGFTGDVSEREFGNLLPAGEVWERSYEIIVR